MGDRLPVKCFMEKVDNKSEQLIQNDLLGMQQVQHIEWL